MTISSTTNRISATGTASTATYPYTFRIFANTDLLVTVKDTSDVETTLTLTTDYTVTGVGTASGNVVLVNASQAWLVGGFLKSGYEIIIRRKRPLTQSTDIRNQGDFYPESHEDALDHLIMICQQQQDEIDRCIKLPESIAGSTFDMELPVAGLTADSVLTVNSTADGFTTGDQTDASASAAAAAASAAAAAASAQETFAAKTTTYQVLTTDSFLTGDATGGAFTMTLPLASACSGRTFKFKKVDSTFSAITIDGSGAETIDGSATTTLNTQYESIELFCNGSAWFINNRTIPSISKSYTPTVGLTGGTLVNTGYYKRVGDSIEVLFDITMTAAFTGGSATITIPSGLTIDTAKIPGTASSAVTKLGESYAYDSSAVDGATLTVYYSSTTSIVLRVTIDDAGPGSNVLYEQNGVSTTLPFTFANGDRLYGKFTVPIVGWN